MDHETAARELAQVVDALLETIAALQRESGEPPRIGSVVIEAMRNKARHLINNLKER